MRSLLARLAIGVCLALLVTAPACATKDVASEAPATDSTSLRADARRIVDENGDSAWLAADGDTVRSRASDDPAYARAYQDAQCSLHEFRRRLTAPPSTQTELAFKGPVSDSTETEYAWLDALELVGDSAVRGILENVPVALRGIEEGDTIVMPLRLVEDWMADDRDTVVGGFSMRIYRDRLNAEQRARYDSASGYHFGSDVDNWRNLVAGCRGRVLGQGAGP
jgi:uncharacterized protein YegJ (DUF2314 family)